MKQQGRKYNFTEKQIEDIIDMYVNQHMSSVKIGEKYECSHKPILKILEENGIDRVRNGVRKYAINEKYFDYIDTQDKAYILGVFICRWKQQP